MTRRGSEISQQLKDGEYDVLPGRNAVYTYINTEFKYVCKTKNEAARSVSRVSGCGMGARLSILNCYTYFPFAASNQHKGPSSLLVKRRRTLHGVKRSDHKADWSSTCDVAVNNPKKSHFYPTYAFIRSLVLRHRDRCIHKNLMNIVSLSPDSL